MMFRYLCAFLCFLSAFALSGQDWYMQEEDEPANALGDRMRLQLPNEENAAKLVELVDNFFASLRLKDIPKAYFAYTSRGFRRVTSLGEFTKFVKGNVVLYENKSVAVKQAYFEKELAIYDGVATATDGTALNVKFILTFEDGEWKINGTQLTPLNP